LEKPAGAFDTRLVLNTAFLPLYFDRFTLTVSNCGATILTLCHSLEPHGEDWRATP